jgi:hypothetical protein
VCRCNRPATSPVSGKIAKLVPLQVAERIDGRICGPERLLGSSRGGEAVDQPVSKRQ